MQQVLADYKTARISEKLRATLALLEKLTLTPDALTPSDVRPVLALGVSREALVDAFYVAFLFNTYDRLADTPQPENAQGFTMQFGSEWKCTALCPCAGTHPLLGFGITMQQIERQCDSGLRHAIVQHVRRVCNNDAAPFCRNQIDAIGADAAIRDDL